MAVMTIIIGKNGDIKAVTYDTPDEYAEGLGLSINWNQNGDGGEFVVSGRKIESFVVARVL